MKNDILSDYACPECGNTDQLTISRVEVKEWDDGTVIWMVACNICKTIMPMRVQ